MSSPSSSRWICILIEWPRIDGKVNRVGSSCSDMSTSSSSSSSSTSEIDDSSSDDSYWRRRWDSNTPNICIGLCCAPSYNSFLLFKPVASLFRSRKAYRNVSKQLVNQLEVNIHYRYATSPPLVSYWYSMILPNTSNTSDMSEVLEVLEVLELWHFPTLPTLPTLLHALSFLARGL